MNSEAKHHNMPNQEGLYGWFPDVLADTKNSDPKNVYVYLGSRPPRERSFHDYASKSKVLTNYVINLKEAKLIYDYYQQQEIERFQKPVPSAEEAITPPWAIQYNLSQRPKTSPVPRSKSASIMKNIPSTRYRVVLNIPKPNLNSFFNVDSNQNKADTTSDSLKSTFCRPQTAAPPSTALTEIFDENKSEHDNASNADPNEAVNAISPTNENQENETVDIEQSLPPSKPIIASNYGRKSLITDEITATVLDDSNQSSKSYNRPKTSFLSRLSKYNKENEIKKRPHSSYIAKNINQVSGGLVEIVNKNHQEPPRIVYSGNRVVNNSINQDMGIVGKKFIQRNKRETPCCTLKEGYWKYDLLNRGDHIHKRPNYYVPIDMESIKPDPERPKVHFNANETFFYNTLPTRKATFVVNQNFISENLRIPKKNSFEEKIRILNSQGKPVKFRRDYAFVY